MRKLNFRQARRTRARISIHVMPEHTFNACDASLCFDAQRLPFPANFCNLPVSLPFL